MCGAKPTCDQVTKAKEKWIMIRAQRQSCTSSPSEARGATEGRGKWLTCVVGYCCWLYSRRMGWAGAAGLNDAPRLTFPKLYTD